MPENWSFVLGGSMLALHLAMQAQGQGEAAIRQTLTEYENRANRAGYYALCFVRYVDARERNGIARIANKLVIQLGWGHPFVGLARHQQNDLPWLRRINAVSSPCCSTGADGHDCDGRRLQRPYRIYRPTAFPHRSPDRQSRDV